MWSRFMLLINSENNSIITLWQNSFRHPFFFSMLVAAIVDFERLSLASSDTDKFKFPKWFLTNVRQLSFFAVTRQANSQCNFPDQAILEVYEKNVNCNILVHRQLIILPVQSQCADLCLWRSIPVLQLRVSCLLRSNAGNYTGISDHRHNTVDSERSQFSV